MLIDSINISSFNAKLLKVDIDTQELSNVSEWPTGTLNPIFLENREKFKKIELELAFKGESRDLILNNISNFMSKLTREVVLTLDSYANKYRCILSANTTEKTVSKHMYKKKLTFLGYEFANEKIETMNRVTSKTINVAGNQVTPAIVEITPSIALVDLTITGLDEDFIKIKNITASKKIIINGEDGTVIVDGANKYGDTEMWSFPSLKPGVNTITVDKSSVDITIKYKPRYI
ncbi:phage distal tail protein [Clostridium sartagoforme]|uniref:phage distal tail protein n=1 Tax=Clostridium sartagoforme TaxID=84031 RepID=UPI0031E0FF39